jgi:ABC-2 type transport system ATP-binding protein
MRNIVLKAEGLTKRYGSLMAVNNLSLEVFEGEVFGFLGPNGAGKSTSINMLCGLLRPDDGQVWVHGQRVDAGTPAWRTRVGVIPQEILLWKQLTCLEQLQFMGEMYGMPARLARQRGMQLLEDLGLAARRSSLARTLSGGMQRRLNLALALVHDPDLVILDEPEAGLDPQSRVQVREYLRALTAKAAGAQPKTLILTTHNMDEAERLADRVAVIDHGELLVVDTPQALKQRLGAGDVLEIEICGLPGQCRAAAAALTDLQGRAQIMAIHEGLTIRALNALQMLPEITAALQTAGLQAGEIKLRQNSLEDVFIQLTGRRLRE